MYLIRTPLRQPHTIQILPTQHVVYPPSIISPQSTTPTPRSLPCIVKGRLLLPTSPEGWEEADHYFESVLVPSLLLSSNPQEISQLLVDGIFSYFSSVCGYRAVRVVKKKKRPPHNGNLKEIKRKKKEAKIALRRARKEGVAPGAIGALAKHFFSLVRSHSKLKRASEVQSASSNAKKARQQCHQHFQKYAKQILDEPPGGEFDYTRFHC